MQQQLLLFKITIMSDYKFCQSCGFPLKKDKKGGGSEKDGSISKKYCSMCYEQGQFITSPEIDTAQKMQVFCIQEMKKSDINGFWHGLAHAPFQAWSVGKIKYNIHS